MNRKINPKKVMQMYYDRHGIEPTAMRIGLEKVYPERDMFPRLSLVHQAFSKAKQIHPKYVSWVNRPFWKKWLHNIFLPSTIIWEYDKWHISKS